MQVTTTGQNLIAMRNRNSPMKQRARSHISRQFRTWRPRIELVDDFLEYKEQLLVNGLSVPCQIVLLSFM